ncbi:metalloregulator ArsR/SmtB family transcription factor [Patulibacter sp. NPDC049589]|uniref:ArsR/SmtB family transcription factor n=1 Tax=Patulibacter sp. NPDC049589 TaxID=3154731 RepID=UPI003414F2DB
MSAGPGVPAGSGVGVAAPADVSPPAGRGAAAGRAAASGGGAASGPAPDLGAVFGALADATRRDVLRRLAGTGDSVTASALAADLPMTRQAVAKHLRALADAGLVVAAREGRETRFRAIPGALDDAVSWMAATGARWDGRLDRLRRKVEGG